MHLTKTDLDMIKQLEICINKISGEEICKKIMDGKEQLKPESSKEKIAIFIKNAIERLDKYVGVDNRLKIMESCGRNCAMINKNVIEKAKKRRNNFKTIDEFLESEQKKPMLGTRLERNNNELFQYYTPKAFSRPMRCYCSLLRGLPENITISKTYCHCSKAFVKKFWEEVLENPVKVELLQSVVTGDSECKFSIKVAD
jgi:predicted hydrocarbon binding protein